MLGRAYHPAIPHVASWVVLTGYGFLVTTLLYRGVGSTLFGVWATIATLRVIGTLVDAGLALGITRDAAISDASARQRLQGSIWLYRRLGLVVGGVGLAFSWIPGTLLHLGPEHATVSILASAIIAVDTGLFVALSPIPGILRGVERFDVVLAGALTTALSGIAGLLLLVPPLGIVGAALAVLFARAGGYAVMGLWLRHINPALLVAKRSRSAIREVTKFARPLWLTAIGTSIGLSTDVPIVAWFFGATAAGHYALGMVIPSVVIGGIWVILDTRFPKMSTFAAGSLTELARTLTMVGLLLAGVIYGLIATLGAEVLTVWLGEAPPLALAVMAAYAVVWTFNVCAHVVMLAAVATEKHHPVAVIVLVEAIANVVLSILLIPSLGAIAPAVATVITVGISNLVVIPLILDRRLGLGLGYLYRYAVLGLALGVFVAVVASQLPALLGLSGIPRLLIATALGILTTALVIQLLRYSIPFRRVLAAVVFGGWRLIADEAAERSAAQSTIASIRAAPAIWFQLDSPLVTVRIATYNRGALIAERALESAISQSHSNLEILVVGDACDEATANAVRGVRDSRIRFINLPERGSYPRDPYHRWMVAGSAPMNHALALARGDWIAPLDDDDEFTRDHVEVLLNACRGESSDFAYGIANTEQADGSWTPVGSWPPRVGHIVHASVLYDSRLRIFQHSLQSWRLAEPGDWNLWRRMQAAGVRMTFVDRVVVRHFRERTDIHPVTVAPALQPVGGPA